ncbi:hypothetical protein V8G54_018157 [Vigna mungo]|uniref:Uncharacterized protein n=1 Tax=Vigna mungo TaxID=3915 RepID=A0AAQ3N8T2_VIGMU
MANLMKNECGSSLRSCGIKWSMSECWDVPENVIDEYESHWRPMRRCHVEDPFPPKVRISQLQNGQGLSLRRHENWRFYHELTWKHDSGIHNSNMIAAQRRMPWPYDSVDGETCEENKFHAFTSCARMMNSIGRKCDLGNFGLRDRHGTLTLKCVIERSSNDSDGKKRKHLNKRIADTIVKAHVPSNPSASTFIPWVHGGEAHELEFMATTRLGYSAM